MLQYNYLNKLNKSDKLRTPSSSALETSPLVPVTSSSHTVVSSSHSYSDSSSLTSSTLPRYELSSFGNKEARLGHIGHISLYGSSAGSLLDPNVTES